LVTVIKFIKKAIKELEANLNVAMMSEQNIELYTSPIRIGKGSSRESRHHPYNDTI